MSPLNLTPIRLQQGMGGASRHILKERFDAELAWDSRLPAPSVPVASWLIGRLQHLVEPPLPDFSALADDEVSLHLVASAESGPLGLVTLTINADGHVRCMLRGESISRLNRLHAQLVDLLLQEPSEVAGARLQLPGDIVVGVGAGAFLEDRDDTQPFDVAPLVEDVLEDSVTAPPLEGSEASCPFSPDELARAAHSSRRTVLPQDLRQKVAVRWRGAKVWIFEIPGDQLVVAVDPEKGSPQIEIFG